MVIGSVSTDNSYLVIAKMAMLQYCYNIGYTIDEEKGFIALYSLFRGYETITFVGFDDIGS